LSAKPDYDAPLQLADIRPGGRNDFQAVFELNLASFAEAWSQQAITIAFEQGCDLDVWHTNGGELAAYYLGRDVLDEVHILQLAVAPGFRRKGLASRLMRHVLEKKYREGLRHVWLEVRASNRVAQRLYAGLGFVIASRRKNYYAPHPPEFLREDALVMCLGPVHNAIRPPEVALARPRMHCSEVP